MNFMLILLQNPNSLPDSWRKFFEGLSDDEKLVYEDLKGPAGHQQKKLKNPNFLQRFSKLMMKI